MNPSASLKHVRGPLSMNSSASSTISLIGFLSIHLHYLGNLHTFSYLHSFQLRDISSSARRRASMSSPGADSYFQEPCEDDSCRDNGRLTLYCEKCECSFCDTCWDKQTPHKPKKRGLVGHAHEKIDRLVVERYQDIFEPPSSIDEQDALKKDEEDATWFGIGHNRAGDPVFEDYGRYTTLMAESLLPILKVRYPHLVSFIGQTGTSSQLCLLFLTFLTNTRSREKCHRKAPH